VACSELCLMARGSRWNLRPGSRSELVERLSLCQSFAIHHHDITWLDRMRISTTKKIKAALGRMSGMTGMYSRGFRSKMLIIAFHRVNDELREDGLTCGSAKFEQFCEFFQENFRVVALSAQVAACQEGREMGGTLSITFDDGYLDNCEVAAPILRRLGLPATFFITSGFMGSSAIAPWDRNLTPAPSWLTWDQVRSLRAQGFDIGAHTDTHVDLGRADPETVKAELKTCQEKLRRELGEPSTLFAYPFGGRDNISPSSLRLVQEAGFACCLSCRGGVNPPVADPFQLNRISIGDWFAVPDQFGFELVVGRA
jgi:peptidoglycan/xylan/chitin deacetylase (PgdA/CDA1 family)